MLPIHDLEIYICIYKFVWTRALYSLTIKAIPTRI